MGTTPPPVKIYSREPVSYYRARYYDSGTGRFLREDPARLEGGINFYRYSVNNPINFNDPLGLCPPTLNQRIALGLKGLANLGIGAAKVAGGSAATAGTGGLAIGLGAYEVGSGLVGNIGGGLVQIIGAATGPRWQRFPLRRDSSPYLLPREISVQPQRLRKSRA